MQQSLIFLLTNELFIPIMLCHRLYKSSVYVNFLLQVLYTYLIRLQTEYLNFHANSATLISMQTRLYIANPKPCYAYFFENWNILFAFFVFSLRCLHQFWQSFYLVLSQFLSLLSKDSDCVV